MPPGSRRAIITPASPVTVSRSPPRQPSAAIVARSATRPEASIRPDPYTTSGRPGGLASGTGRPAPGLPGRRRPRPEAGMIGATGRPVTAAFRTGGTGNRDSRKGQPPSTRVRVVRGLGEIAPKSVSEGGLCPCPWWYIPESGIYHHPKLTRKGPARPQSTGGTGGITGSPDESSPVSCGTGEDGQPGWSRGIGPDRGIRLTALVHQESAVTAVRCCPAF